MTHRVRAAAPALLVFVRALLCVSDISTNRGLMKRKTKTGHTHITKTKKVYCVFYYSYVARTGLESRSCFFKAIVMCICGSIYRLHVIRGRVSVDV